MDSTTVDAEVIRRAIGTLLPPGGGVLSPSDLQVTQNGTPNMSVNVAAGQAWIVGTSTATQGLYYTRNGAIVNMAISAANPSNPRIDQVIVQVQDKVYAGSSASVGPTVITGTPTAGASLSNLVGLGSVPASSLLLAYVLVPANATSIVTADIANVAPQTGPAASRGAVNIAASQSTSSTSYTTLSTPDQVTGIVLPLNGKLRVGYQAGWQESVAGAARAAIFIGGNQLKCALATGQCGTQAAWTTSAGALGLTSLATCPMGLLSCVPQPYAGDVTTGQAIGLWGNGNNVGFELNGSAVTDALGTTQIPLGGACEIFAAAGVYTISVQFKASSGSVTASNRKLWVEAIPFS